MSRRDRNGVHLSLLRVSLQVTLFGLALFLWGTPLLQPLKLLVVLLHEMSHALMALATGGTVQDVIITPQEGGACHTTGGNAILIVSSGYLGSMFFGGWILSASRSRASTTITCGLLSFLLIGAAFTVLGDVYSRRFALVMAASFVLITAFAPGFLSIVLLRGVGTVSSLYAIFDIYNDTLSKVARKTVVESDAVAFSKLTGISPETIGLGWLFVSVVYFIVMLRSSVTPEREPATLPSQSAAPA